MPPIVDNTPPLAAGQVPAMARDLVALADGFAAAGPRRCRARRARDFVLAL